MDFAPLVAVGALVMKLLDFGKYVHVRDWNGAVTQLVAWLAGVGAVLLAARTDFAESVRVNEFLLGDLNLASQVFLGVLATSLFSAVYDLKRAIDHSDSAAMPSLTNLKGGKDGASE